MKHRDARLVQSRTVGAFTEVSFPVKSHGHVGADVTGVGKMTNTPNTEKLTVYNLDVVPLSCRVVDEIFIILRRAEVVSRE